MEIISTLKELLNKRKEHSESWYFSPAGEKAYASLTTDVDRTKFFLDYLKLVARFSHESDDVEALYRLAYVMVSSMVNSSLEFGGYPNVLDEEKNPLVKYVKNNRLTSNRTSQYKLENQIVGLLCALHHETEDKMDEYEEPYECLTFCDKNTPLSDMYKIERDIILMFGFTDEDYSHLYFPYTSQQIRITIDEEDDSDSDENEEDDLDFDLDDDDSDSDENEEDDLDFDLDDDD